jgi:hypothetical protein
MAKTIIAKLTCETVTTGVQFETVRLKAAHGPGNEEWSKFTPSGSVELTITNPDAQGAFEPGKSYAVTFAPIVDDAG